MWRPGEGGSPALANTASIHSFMVSPRTIALASPRWCGTSQSSGPIAAVDATWMPSCPRLEPTNGARPCLTRICIRSSSALAMHIQRWRFRYSSRVLASARVVVAIEGSLPIPLLRSGSAARERDDGEGDDRAVGERAAQRAAGDGLPDTLPNRQIGRAHV